MWIQAIGLVGGVMLLLAYYLVSQKKLDGGSRFYQVLNVLGGAMLAVLTLYAQAWGALMVNVFWVVIGVGTLGKISAERKALKSKPKEPLDP